MTCFHQGPLNTVTKKLRKLKKESLKLAVVQYFVKKKDLSLDLKTRSEVSPLRSEGRPFQALIAVNENVLGTVAAR